MEIEYWDEEKMQFSTWVAPETPDPAREGYACPDHIVHALDQERALQSRVRQDVQEELEFTKLELQTECQETVQLKEELQAMKDNLQRDEYYLVEAYKEVDALKSEVRKGKK